MRRNELSLAVAMAQSDCDLQTFIGEGSSQDLNELFNGYGLSDAPVHVTIPQLAALIRHEAMMMNGELCGRVMDSIAAIGKTKFIIIGLGDEDVIQLLECSLPGWYETLQAA